VRVSTAALVRHGQALLFVKRPPGGDLGGLWELPGGKVDAGESPQEALRRELREELSVESRVGRLRAVSGFTHRGIRFDLQAYEVELDRDSICLEEHTELCWKSPREALHLDLAPSDRDLLAQMLRDGEL
jgi:mutator protein MutT